MNVPHLVLSAAARAGEPGVSVVQRSNRMYFHVPPNLDTFKIEVRTPYVAEQASLVVWDPSGRKVATARTFERLPAVATLSPTTSQRGKVWSFQMRPTYSADLKWDERLPPYVAESPEALLVPVEE